MQLKTPIKSFQCLLHVIPSSKRASANLVHHVEGENTQGRLHLNLHEKPVEDGGVEEKIDGRVCRMMVWDCGIIPQNFVLPSFLYSKSPQTMFEEQKFPKLSAQSQ